MKYIRKLIEFGLSDNEAKIYVTCLKSGNERASVIAKRADLPKTTTIDVLNSLNSKGFVSKYRKKNVYYFSAADPNILESIAKKQQSLLDSLLPQLHSIHYSERNQISVRFFDNKKGYETVQEEILREAKDVMMISPDAGLMFDTMPEYFPKLTHLRIKHGVFARVILEDSEVSRKVKFADKKELRETRLAKINTPFQALFILWKNKILVLSITGDNPVLIIEDEGISNTLRTIFEILWNTLEE